MEEVQHILVGLLGACLGSFCSVLVCRVPAGASVIAGRSRCVYCERSLRWYELIPVVSYAIQRGSCRGCRHRISPAYPAREIVMSVCCLTLFYEFGCSIDWVRFTLLAVLLITISEIDYQHLIVPNSLVAAGGMAGLLPIALQDPKILGEALLASGGTASFLLIVRYASRWMLGQAGLGMGDVKLMAMIACFIGWNSIWAFYLATLLGGLAGVAGMAAGRIRRWTRIPFAPFIAAGVACSAFIHPVEMLAWFS